MGRNLKTSKFKATVNDAISRLAFLKKQRRARCAVSLSDVAQLLNLGYHERALHRVELVIKEQDRLDAFDMMEGYCNLLIERVNLIEQEKCCPEELKEAISSLIYAATRCGELPELQDIRIIFTSWYGKEFVAHAVELRKNCGVNPKIVQKLSTRMTSLENRVKVLKEIAAENDIVLQLEDVVLEITHEGSISNEKEKMKMDDAQKPYSPTKSEDFKMGCVPLEPVDFDKIEGFADLKRCKDVADVAQAASEPTAYAAAAARAVVELSHSESHDPDDSSRSRNHSRGSLNSLEPVKSRPRSKGQKDLRGIKDLEVRRISGKIHPVQAYSCETEEEEMVTDDMIQRLKQAVHLRKILATRRAESAHKILKETKTATDEYHLVKLHEREIVCDECEDVNRHRSMEMISRAHDLSSHTNQVLCEVRRISGKSHLVQAYSCESEEEEEEMVTDDMIQRLKQAVHLRKIFATRRAESDHKILKEN